MEEEEEITSAEDLKNKIKPPLYVHYILITSKFVILNLSIYNINSFFLKK